MVVKIALHTDLPTPAQNALRYALELGIWRAKWRRAEAENDYYMLDRLNGAYEMVGLP